MILYGDLSKIEIDKIYVCGHCTDEGYKIDEFTIFAYIEDMLTTGVLLRRFQRFGKVKYIRVFMKWEDFKHYYNPLKAVLTEEKKND